jgi:hypothetical protein
MRRPVRREGAERYLLVTLVSFAATVIGTRWFLTITGFPQIGGDLHIASGISSCWRRWSAIESSSAPRRWSHVERS